MLLELVSRGHKKQFPNIKLKTQKDTAFYEMELAVGKNMNHDVNETSYEGSKNTDEEHDDPSCCLFLQPFLK